MNTGPIDPRLGRVLGEKKAASVGMKVWGSVIGIVVSLWLGSIFVSWLAGGDDGLIILSPIITGVAVLVWIKVIRNHMPENPIPAYLDATRKYTEVSNLIAWETEQQRKEELDKIIGEWDE